MLHICSLSSYFFSPSLPSQQLTLELDPRIGFEPIPKLASNSNQEHEQQDHSFCMKQIRIGEYKVVRGTKKETELSPDLDSLRIM